ncbi:tetratricopeptide repeat protein [Orbaceae bacterium ac157xtp]
MTEEQKINEDIEKFKKIKRTANNHSEYAEAQYQLGEIYHLKLEDYQQAEKYYLNVLKEDTPTLYAIAQCQLGEIYNLRLKKHKQAEKYYLNVSKEDNPAWYTVTQCQLGEMYAFKFEDYQQAEKYYSHVLKEDNPALYAKAQCQLGDMYNFKLENYSQAEKYYLNVLKEDNSKWHAIAQFRLGEIYNFNLENYQQAEKYYLDVLKEDDTEWYAKAQCQLGEMYDFKLEDYQQAKQYYLNVSKEDNPEWYAIAQCQLGKIYDFKLNNHDYQKAEEHYSNVLKEDNPEWYAKAQCYLGRIYDVESKDYQQAEKYYLNVSKEDNPAWYAIAQCKLGEMHAFKLKDYQKAEKYYSNVLKEDNLAWFAIAQCNLGTLFFIQNDQEKAGNYFKNVCFDHKESYYKAQLYLALINNKGNDRGVEYILNNLQKISESVAQIKEKLLVKLDTENEFERKISHYTKPEVLFHFLKDKSKMRLSLVDLMNDPMENKVLLNWLNINPNQDINKIKSFVSSFSFNHNSLNQFRLYGLEDNVYGSGVSIVFNKNFFSSTPKEETDYIKITDKQRNQVKNETLENITLEDTNKSIFPLPLYRCIYFEPESGYIKIAKRNKQSFYREFPDEDVKEIEKKWEKYIENINESEILEKIRTSLKEIKEKIEESRIQIEKIGQNYLLPVFEELVHLAIMPISCLIKHSAFEDEDECRIMYTTHVSDKLIIGPKDYQAINTTLYLDYSEIGNFINKVYLGPKCKSSHQQWIEHATDELNVIKVQNSTLPLQ